ncbi:MAG: type II/IV secretion system ATPase subunit [Desulfurococcales archaeon]|nr:type II/IV secretion system ATPase subunit [Desulfurococcales archaeon]
MKGLKRLLGKRKKEEEEVRERIRIVKIEAPAEVRVSVRLSVKEEKPEEAPKEEKKRKFKLLGGKKERPEAFKLPSLSIITAKPFEIGDAEIIRGPYKVPGAPHSEIIITSDKRYIIRDPELTQETLAELEKALTQLFFLTESEEIAKALEDEEELNKLLKKLNVSPEVEYLIRRELFGYGVLEPLMRDPDIEDFQVPAVGVPVKALHRELGPLEVNIVFDSDDDINRYIEKFVAKTGSSVSLYMPLASLQLPEGHRLTVAYSRETTTRGPVIVVRKFPEKAWSITRIMQKKALTPEMAAWLWLAVEAKQGIMIVGPMGSGKTSVMNAIANFIPRDATIVTIEDTPELRLSHPYWIQHKTRESLTLEGRGSIDMFDLVKHALRESADYLIVGEVRGEEGKVWAQAIATGHGGITTFHAESPQAMIARLTSPPINVEKSLMTALKVIVTTGRFLKKIERDGRTVAVPIRRVTAIYDYNYDPLKDKDEITPIFKYDLATDTHEQVTDITWTTTAKRIMDLKGWSETELVEEYNRRVRLLQRLREHIERYEGTPLLDYAEVTRVFWLFQEDPEKAYAYIEEVEKRLESGKEAVQEVEAPKTYEEVPPSEPKIRILDIKPIGLSGEEEIK